MASLPRPSRRKCGSRKLISKKASGYSVGMSSSLHTLPGGGIIGGAGIALFHARGELRGVRRVQLVDRAVEGVERHRQVGPLLAQVLLPVHPAAHELAVVASLADEDV